MFCQWSTSPGTAGRDRRNTHLADGCTSDETEEQLSELKKHFPTPRDAVAYVMDTFPIVKRREEAAFGAYRTKEKILEIYARMGASDLGK